MAAEYGININVRTKDEQLKRLQKELTSADRKVASLNKQLTELEKKTKGGRGADGGNYALVTKDGGYLSVGYTDSYGFGKNDIWVIKTDFTGEKEWSKVYGGKLDDFGYK